MSAKIFACPNRPDEREQGASFWEKQNVRRDLCQWLWTQEGSLKHWTRLQLCDEETLSLAVSLPKLGWNWPGFLPRLCYQHPKSVNVSICAWTGTPDTPNLTFLAAKIIIVDCYRQDGVFAWSHKRLVVVHEACSLETTFAALPDRLHQHAGRASQRRSPLRLRHGELDAQVQLLLSSSHFHLCWHTLHVMFVKSRPKSKVGIWFELGQMPLWSNSCRRPILSSVVYRVACGAEETRQGLWLWSHRSECWAHSEFLSRSLKLGASNTVNQTSCTSSRCAQKTNRGTCMLNAGGRSVLPLLLKTGTACRNHASVIVVDTHCGGSPSPPGEEAVVSWSRDRERSAVTLTKCTCSLILRPERGLLILFEFVCCSQTSKCCCSIHPHSLVSC